VGAAVPNGTGSTNASGTGQVPVFAEIVRQFSDHGEGSSANNSSSKPNGSTKAGPLSKNGLVPVRTSPNDLKTSDNSSAANLVALAAILNLIVPVQTSGIGPNVQTGAAVSLDAVAGTIPTPSFSLASNSDAANNLSASVAPNSEPINQVTSVDTFSADAAGTVAAGSTAATNNAAAQNPEISKNEIQVPALTAPVVPFEAPGTDSQTKSVSASDVAARGSSVAKDEWGALPVIEIPSVDMLSTTSTAIPETPDVQPRADETNLLPKFSAFVQGRAVDGANASPSVGPQVESSVAAVTSTPKAKLPRVLPQSQTQNLSTQTESRASTPPIAKATAPQLTSIALRPSISPSPAFSSTVLNSAPHKTPVTADSDSALSSSNQSGSQDAGTNHKETDQSGATPSSAPPLGSATVHDLLGLMQVPGNGGPTQISQVAAQANPNTSQTTAIVATLVPDRPPISAGNLAQPTSPATAHAAPLPNADGNTTGFVNTAKLLEMSGHSEMRIAMDTDKLGPVELRAKMAGDEVGASIMVEKRDAHAALAIELPALQQALSEKQLHVEHVTLLHGSFSSTTGDSGATGNREANQAPRTPQTQHTGWNSETVTSSGFSATNEATGIFNFEGRLSVRV
jgi:flagellar hook-length control protein FliK